MSKKLLLAASLLASTFMPNAFAAGGAEGSVQLSGNVPEIFTLQSRGVPGDVDLSPGVVVTDRLLGIFHLKYNLPVGEFKIQTDTTSGLPEDSAGTPIDLATPMSYKMACTSAVETDTTATEAGAGKDIKSAAAALSGGVGIEEDCLLSASWVGTSSAIPLSGYYTMKISATLTAQ